MSSMSAPGSSPNGPRPRPDFERIALLLQGGGALGSYQAGVYQALAEANLHPDWVAGISIGAINAALIAGNPPERRVEKLRAFWETVTAAAARHPLSRRPRHQERHAAPDRSTSGAPWARCCWARPSFFKPRFPPPIFTPAGNPGNLSFYDIAPLKALLEQLVDFDRHQRGRDALQRRRHQRQDRQLRLLRQRRRTRSAPQHVMASGSLPPGFPATEIDGEFYWDGGIVSNTPLQWVLDARPRARHARLPGRSVERRGELPRDMIEVDVRQKDIRYSSRTRAGTDQFRKHAGGAPRRRQAAGQTCRAELRQTPEAELLAQEADSKVYNIIHLIYHARSYEGASKDYEFSRRTMEEHWKSGYDDMIRTLRHPEVLQRPHKRRRRVHLRSRTGRAARRPRR